MRPSLLLASVLLLQTCGFWTAGCAANRGSPLDIDERAVKSRLYQDVAACPNSDAVHAMLVRETEAYAAQADRLIAARSALRQEAAKAAAVSDRGLPVPGAQVESLNRAFAEASAATRAVAVVAARHDPWHRRDAPSHDDGLRTFGTALSVAAALELYDSYLECGALVGAHPQVRKILDRGDAAYGTQGGELDAVARDYLNLARRFRTHDAIAFLHDHGYQVASGDEHLVFLRERIEHSPSARTLRLHWLIPLGEFTGESVNLARSDLLRLRDAALGGASQGFGNAVGAVQFRRGLLHDNPDIEATLRARLQPGDILLEKTPFRLTDRFIPGHWGHVAVWLGSDSEVRTLLGDDPLLTPHLRRLASGAGVCEALRNGVQLNPLAHFLDIDDVAVLRCPSQDPAAQAEHLRRCLRQLGKAYDFNFDVETADRIVCSELVYQVYTAIPWPTSKAMGRSTISPDHVAQRALTGGPLVVVELWHDGKRIDGDLTNAMAKLINPH